MKTLCVAAVVVLSLTSVCQAASLACEKLLKPVDNDPDLRGSWYLIAISSQSCWVSTVVSSVLWPSIEVNVTSKDTRNIYTAEYKYKFYGYCETDSEDYLYENNTLFDVNVNSTPLGQPDELLQSGCPDCFVVKDDYSILFLFSRRQNVTDAELKEFESQADCLGWSKPQVFNSDHDHTNCLSVEDGDEDMSRLSSLIFERMKNTYTVQLKCFTETFYSLPDTAFKWTQQSWSNFFSF
ncbi:uncharacterized protein [Cebidichthys violaceus]|uniref:uncharacterized protein n=1 Tax=Cebidichthys violaceus TaxID=271503 RepID=UPI0035CC712B